MRAHRRRRRPRSAAAAVGLGKLVHARRHHGDRRNPRADCDREVREEPGLYVEISGLLGIYTDPQHIIAYSDGEVRQEFVIAYTARVIGGTLAVSDESEQVRFIHPDDMDAIRMHESTRLRLKHWRAGSMPFLG
jgi:ADP-ribose pyrophosphatase YjhB (NUDIX family)